MVPTPCRQAQSRSAHSFRTSLFGILAILLLAGCAGRPTLLPLQEESFAGETVPVYFVTTRAPSGSPDVYSGARALSASYGRVDVGIPRDRTLGTLPTTDGRPDPARHFHQNGIYRYQRFAQMRDAALTASGGMGVSLFVHGYNNTFAESLFRLAQLHHDAGQTGAAIAFQ